MINHPSIYLRGTCRACRAPLTEILSLGPQRLNAFPKHRWEIDQIHRVPLVLMACTGCGLVQLDRTVPPDWMYRHYWYLSGVNERMVAELRAIVEEACALVPVGSTARVLDIGANDGTLLAQYAQLGLWPERYAIEPALNLQDRLKVHADRVIPDYFPVAMNSSQQPVLQFQIITAIAMCYDLEEPLKFFQAIHDLLAPGGVAVIQFQDFGQQVESAAFDNIVHEHLEYYTLWSLTHLFLETGLRVQRAQQTPINGGSLRLHLRRVEDHVQPEDSVVYQLIRETRQGLDTPTLREGNLEVFTTFRRRVEAAKMHVAAAIEVARAQGCTIDVYGASTKGNILLQMLGLGPTEVRQAIERSPEKWGSYTITGIPIVSEEQGRADPAGVWLVPIWQFKAAILERERWFLEQGGTMIFPLPYCEVVAQTQRPWPLVGGVSDGPA